MADTYTTRNRFEKMEPGAYADTWASRANGQFGSDLIDAAMDGVEALTVSGSVTLSTANGSTDQARKRVLNCTGTGGTVTIPNLEKTYFVRNATSGTVTFTTGSGTSAAVPSGNVQWVFCTGANACYISKRNDFGSDNISTTGTATFSVLARPSFGKGYLFSNAVAGADTGTNPIIAVDGSVNDTTLGSFYGCGFSKQGAATFLSNFSNGVPNWGLYVAANGTARAFISGDNGSIYSQGQYFVDNIQVVQNRQTGWSAPSGTLSRATFDQSTVTLPQLAQRLAALITDLTAHGLIGA